MTQRSDNHPEPSSALGPDVVLDVWRRRKWIGILAFSAVCAGAITAAVSLPNLYRATATVLVERQQVSEAFVRPSVTAELETRIQTIHQQVMSRARLADVITRLGLYPDLRSFVPLDALVERMRREIQLSLTGVDQTTGRTSTIAFTLSYSGRDPQRVAEVTNTLAAFYVAENTKSRERQASQTAEFLKAQLGDIKRELDEQERRVSEFKLRHAGELQQVEVNLTALDRLNTQLRLNSESQVRAMNRRERLEQQLADAESAAPATVRADTPAAQLLKLKQALAELRRRFSDQYPDVIRVKAEIAAIEQEIAQRGQRGTDGDTTASAPVDPAMRLAKQSLGEVDRELNALKAEEASLRKAIAGYEGRVENAPRSQQELQQLSRGYDAVSERYQSLLKRSEEAQLAENLEQGQSTEQFRILDPAIPPAQPAAPNRLWLLAMGFLASLALGFGAIVAAEKFDTTFHTVDHLQAFTNLPMLARIRLIPTAVGRRRHRLRLALMTAAVIVGLAVIVAGSYHVAAGNEQIVRLTARPTI
jgi:polysaccharide chain length determinant protein (PEP-CTERM system associated)